MPARNTWGFLSFEERHSEMTFLIHPTLMECYQAFYQTDAPMLRCTTCHSEDAERKLYFPDAVLSEEQRFKRDVITPLMARLMGVPAYDTVTGVGFSCFGCHPREFD